MRLNFFLIITVQKWTGQWNRSSGQLFSANSSNVAPNVGGNSNESSGNAGPGYFNRNTVGNSNTNIGARLKFTSINPNSLSIRPHPLVEYKNESGPSNGQEAVKKSANR